MDESLASGAIRLAAVLSLCSAFVFGIMGTMMLMDAIGKLEYGTRVDQSLALGVGSLLVIAGLLYFAIGAGLFARKEWARVGFVSLAILLALCSIAAVVRGMTPVYVLAFAALGAVEILLLRRDMRPQRIEQQITYSDIERELVRLL